MRDSDERVTPIDASVVAFVATGNATMQGTKGRRVDERESAGMAESLRARGVAGVALRFRDGLGQMPWELGGTGSSDADGACGGHCGLRCADVL